MAHTKQQGSGARTTSRNGSKARGSGASRTASKRRLGARPAGVRGRASDALITVKSSGQVRTIREAMKNS